MRRLAAATVATAAALVICGLGVSAGAATAPAGRAVSAARPAQSGGAGSSVTISNESGQTWTCGFNPYNLNVNYLSFGTVYEELLFINLLQNGKVTPWLASSYAWSNGNRTLTFTIRHGISWSDGKPFSAADVVFTFQLLRAHPALDVNADWSALTSVTEKGSDQVVFQFKSAAVPLLYVIADQTPIVSQHIWSKISNPVTYLDSHPVGTGPYVVNTCTPANIKYTRNPAYWQHGLPRISTIYYPSFTSNDPANAELANGTAQWGSQFIPNIQSYYLAKSKDFHIWFPPVTNVMIFINLKNPILSNLAVRRAMAYAINRPLVSRIGEYGYEPPANQANIVTPTYSGWLDTKLMSQYDYSYNPGKALSILEQAGYKMVGGVMEKGGQKLSFTMDNVGGFSDWVASAQIVTQELKAVGIQVTPSNLTSTTFDDQVFNGNFQLAYYAEAEIAGPAPYYAMRQLLYSANSAPIGKPASTNYERYSDPKTDALLNAYGATTSLATQKQITDELERVLLTDVPVIPTTEQVDWYQYDTANIGGWATPSDPYAQPAAYDYPDWGVMLLHLYPKK